jgi:potassium efflux system protein
LPLASATAQENVPANSLRASSTTNWVAQPVFDSPGEASDQGAEFEQGFWAGASVDLTLTTPERLSPAADLPQRLAPPTEFNPPPISYPVQPTAFLQADEAAPAEAPAAVSPSTPALDEKGAPVDLLEKVLGEEVESLKSDAQLDESTKSARLNVLNTAIEWTQKGKSYQRKFDRYQMEINRFDEDFSTAQEQLRFAEISSAFARLETQQPIDVLQRENQRVLSELELKKSELAKLHSSLQRYNQRISEVPKQKSEAQKRLKKVSDQLTEMPAETGTRDEAKLLQLAIRAATTVEVEMLSVESRYLELSSQLSPVRIDLTNHFTKQLESQYRELTKAVESARQREVEQQIQLARQAALDAHPRLAAMAQRNEELALQRQKIAESIAAISVESSKLTEQMSLVESELTSLQKKVNEGLNTANTLLLAESRRRLVSPLESRVRLSQLNTELQNANFAKSRLQDERESLSDPEAVIVEQLGIQLENVDDHLHSTALEFVESKRTLLDNLLNDYRSYQRWLSDTTVQREQLVTGIKDTQELLNKHMLWVPSADPISLATIKKSSEGLSEFFAANRWNELTNRLIARATDRPYEYLMFTIGCAFLYGVVRRLKG